MLTGVAFLTFSVSYAGKVVKKAVQAPILNGQAQSVQTISKYQVQASITKVWNGSTWVNSDKMTYTYNSNGLLIYDLDQGWNVNAWVNNATDSFTYDAMNRQITHISTSWIDSIKAFVHESKITDSFSGNINTATNYGWSSPSWIPQYRDMIYSHNAHDTLDINQFWSNGAWVNSQKTDSILNSKGMDSLSYISTWMSGKWYITDKYQYFYDANGNDTLYKHLHGDSLQDLSLAFEQENKYTYNGTQITLLIQNGSYNSTSWFTMAKYTYTYDANGNDTQTTYDTGSSLSNYLIYSYSYNTLTGMQKLNPKLNMALYPNPMLNTSTFIVTVSSPAHMQFNFVDMNGNTAKAPHSLDLQAGENSFSIARDNLPSGVYFIVLSGEGVYLTNKLVVE